MPATSVILAIDTATGPCSVALWKDGGVAAYRENLKPTAQSAALMPMVEEALAESGVAYKDLTAVACTIGPGSFTGIRVGLAAARGIAFAARIPGLGFTTLETLAFAASKKASGQAVLAITNAGKGEWYHQAFSISPQWRPLYDARVEMLELAVSRMKEPATVAGNAETLPLHLTHSHIIFPRADALAGLAAVRTAQAQPLMPFYIRLPDARPMTVDR